MGGTLRRLNVINGRYLFVQSSSFYAAARAAKPTLCSSGLQKAQEKHRNTSDRVGFSMLPPLLLRLDVDITIGSVVPTNM